MYAVPHMLIYLVPALIAGVLTAIVWRRRYMRGGRPFALLMAAICWWCTCHAISVFDPTYSGTLFWSLIQYVGIVLVGPCWLLLALAYSGQWWRTYRWFRLGLFAPELLLLTVALTNDVHGLWWPSVLPDTSRGFMWLSVTRGPFFWLHSAYAYLCVLSATVLLGWASLHAAPVHRYHARLMLIASLIPAVGNIAFIGGLRVPWNDDPTPLMLLGSGMLAFYATMRYRLVDLAPLAEREIFSGLPDGVVVLDSRGLVADLNDLAPGLLGLPRDRWAGRALADLAARSPIGAELKQFLAGGQGPHTRQLVYQENGELRALELRRRPLLTASGAATGSLLLIRDVSDRIRAERERAQHLAELSLISQLARAANGASDTAGLIRAVVDGIVAERAWDRATVGLRDRDGSFKIVADVAPDGAPSYEGALADEAEAAEMSAFLARRGAHLVQLTAPAYAESALAARLRTAGLHALIVVPLYHQGESIGLLALASAGPISDSQARLHMAETIGELITDAVVRARLYEEVRYADQLKASFLATVSHELRTPLTAIIGYTEMIQRGIYGRPDQAMEEPLGHMRYSGVSMMRLVNDILDFSRMQSGKLRVELQPVDLRHTLAHVVGQIQPQIRERGLELFVTIDDDLPLALASPQRVEQIVINLLNNAIKFTERGRIAIQAGRHREMVRISVQDSGVGIAPENHQLIFQEFRRIDAADGRRYSGAGLGLAICRRLAELMGGTISVESAVGAGSTFHCDLPVAMPVELHAGAAARAGR